MMQLIPWAFSFAEWFCIDDDGVNAPRGCRMKVDWADAVLIEEGGRLVAVLHASCAEVS